MTRSVAARDPAHQRDELRPFILRQRREQTLLDLLGAHAAGHKAERDAYVEPASAALQDLDDPEDRDLIASQLSTVPEL